MSTITTTSGKVVSILPVSETLVLQALAKIEENYRARGELLDIPFYTVTIAGGATENVSHDESTLIVENDPEQTKKNQEAWAKYQDAKNRLVNEQSRQRDRIMLLRGIDIQVPNDGWDKEQEALFGVEIPTDPIDRKYHYLTTEILVNVDDYLLAIGEISRLSLKGLVSEEVLNARLESFRSELQQRFSGPSTKENIAVETQSITPGDSYGKGMGTNAESV